MTERRSYTFTHTISRMPGESIAKGIRAEDIGDPDPGLAAAQLSRYVVALEEAGVTTTVLEPLDDLPDSVFVEDAAICIGRTVITTRPGAPTRFGEVAALRPTLEAIFEEVRDLDTEGFIDGGDVLLTDTEAFIGLSERTDDDGFAALGTALADYSYTPRKVITPPDVLHFKSDCGLLDSETIFSTRRLAASDCFDGYRVIEAPEGEEEAANLIRVNDTVIVRSGFPRTVDVLSRAGFNVREVDTSEAAKVDGGLSCMSLRFALT